MTDDPRLVHYMIDVETLGLDHDAAVWQVGLLEFDLNEQGTFVPPAGYRLNCLINADEISRLIYANKLSYDMTTIEWTLEQPNARLFKYWASSTFGIVNEDRRFAFITDTKNAMEQRTLADPPSQLRIGELVAIFKMLTMDNESNGKQAHFWAKGKEFDFPRLENLFRLAGTTAPWRYWQLHCVRDITALPFMLRGKPAPRPTGLSHDAIDDCRTQVANLHVAVNEIWAAMDEVGEEQRAAWMEAGKDGKDGKDG